MQTPEENGKARSAIPKYRIMVFFLLILSVVCLAFVMYLRSASIDIRSLTLRDVAQIFAPAKSSSSVSVETEIIYDPLEQGLFGIYRGSIVRCDRRGIRALNNKGEETWSVNTPVNNPILRVSSGYLLAADIGGRDVYVLNGKSIHWSKKAEGNIINADINDSGYVAVVREIKGYKAAVTVYSPQGDELFTRVVASNHILSAKVSPSSSFLTINCIDTSATYSKAVLEFVNMAGKPVATRMEHENLIYPSLAYLTAETVLAVGDSKAVCLEKDSSEKWSQAFEGRQISASGTWLGRYVVIAAGGGNRGGMVDNTQTEVRIISTAGKQLAVLSIDGGVRSIKTYNDVFAAVTARNVYYINTKGVIIGKYISKSDIKDVHFFNGNESAVVTKNSIAVINLE